MIKVIKDWWDFIRVQWSLSKAFLKSAKLTWRGVIHPRKILTLASVLTTLNHFNYNINVAFIEYVKSGPWDLFFVFLQPTSSGQTGNCNFYCFCIQLRRLCPFYIQSVVKTHCWLLQIDLSNVSCPQRFQTIHLKPLGQVSLLATTVTRKRCCGLIICANLKAETSKKTKRKWSVWTSLLDNMECSFCSVNWSKTTYFYLH